MKHMHTESNIVTTPVVGEVSARLQRAIEAVQRLEESGCKVLRLIAGPRHTTVIVMAPPPFVQGVCKSRFRNPAGGITRVMAARYFGVQLEWFLECRQARAVSHA
ncbi:hypothetical protein [Pseudoxanthomonas mexicana]|uniref:hypothetical protein n=1 Tax=Pseudoxanthomonas mexicana TaxID=128785 RepID=UPI00398B3B3E